MNAYPTLHKMYYSTWGLGFYTEHWLTDLNCWMFGMTKLMEKNIDLNSNSDVLTAYEKLCASDHMFVYDDPNQQALAKSIFIEQFNNLANKIRFNCNELAVTYPIDPFQSIFLYITTNKPESDIRFKISKLCPRTGESLKFVNLTTKNSENAGIWVYYQYFMLQPDTDFQFQVSNQCCETQFKTPELGLPMYVEILNSTRQKYDLDVMLNKMNEIWGKNNHLPQQRDTSVNSQPVYTKDEIRNLLSGRRVAIYKYNKECYSLLRFPQLVPFEIACVFDDMNGFEDSGEHLLGEKNDIPVISDLSRIKTESFDALIFTCGINHGSETPYFDALMAHAKSQSILVVSLYEDVLEYEAFSDDKFDSQNFFKIGLTDKTASPISETAGKNLGKVLSVFGTDSVQGKFTTQLYLRESLKKQLNVCHWATEPTGALLGAELGYSRYYGELDEDAERDLESRMIESVRSTYQLTITGGQNSIIYSIPGRQKGNNVSSQIYRRFKPEYVVLTISVDTELSTIENSLKYLTKLSATNGVNTKVVALVMLTGRKIGGSRWTDTTFVQVLEDSVKNAKNKFEQAFNIPVYSIPEQVDFLANDIANLEL